MDQKQKIIIYGAGKRGKQCLDFLEWKGSGHIVWGFCDVKYTEIKHIKDKPVVSYKEAKTLKLPFLISCTDPYDADDIKKMIEGDGLDTYLFDGFYKFLREDQTTFLREWCAFHHIKNNDMWFKSSEEKKEVDIFWAPNTPFYQFFKKLDLENVIELACGRGRHLPYYHKMAERITLVDILIENIDYCKERFKKLENVNYYQNNGYNLDKLHEDTFTALFTYDSMVHFELMDVYTYLQDTYRVLKKGGRALFHHSNYDADPKIDFAHSPHARCFMNKDIFAYLALRAGFDILGQEVIDWHGAKKLDCVTLVEK